MTDIDPFAPAGDTPRTTEFHSFPLPPRLRAYEPERDRFGRYLLPDPVSGKVQGGTRTTTLADTLDDRFNVHRWEKRAVIQGLKSHAEILEDVDTLADVSDLNKDLDRALERAMVAAGTKYGSEYGTAVHEWCEVVDAGKVALADVPDVFRPKVERYLRRLAEFGITVADGMIERIVRNDARQTTGTFDRIYRLADGSLAIGDIKTGKNLDFAYMAISAQMAAYADAEYLLSEDGTSWEAPLDVRKDIAVVVWIPSDQDDHVELVTIDLWYGRQVLDHAVAVRGLRKNAKAGVKNTIEIPRPAVVETPTPVAPTEPTPEATDVAPNGQPRWAYDELLARIDQAVTPEELGGLWEAYKHVWTDEFTARGQSALVRAAEQRAAVTSANPFASAAG